MWRLYLLLIVVWLILLPPLFTNGACTAQFDAEVGRLDADAAGIRTFDAAMEYWALRHQSVVVVTSDDCRRAKPRFLSSCGSGPLVIAKVPVTNTICRVFRDSEVLVQLQYDELGRLARVATDMAPYKSLPLPFIGITLHWAR